MGSWKFEAELVSADAAERAVTKARASKANVSIPAIEDRDGLALGIRYAKGHPDTWWYVVKRAVALHAEAQLLEAQEQYPQLARLVEVAKRKQRKDVKLPTPRRVSASGELIAMDVGVGYFNITDGNASGTG